MRTVLGAGSVGLALAAQLASAGREVLVVARRAEQAAALRAGLTAEDPIAGGERRVAVEAAASLQDAARRIGPGPVFVCTREPDVEAAGRALAHACGTDVVVVALQNDLHGGALLARSLRRVVAGLWRQTATRVGDARVRYHGRARVVVGAEPGCDAADAARVVARDLADAGLDAAFSRSIRDDQWLKLCVNLTSAPNALVRREDHAGAAFVELKARLLEEARAALAAAGIRPASCDGRDRDLDAEIAHVRGALARGDAARPFPLYNHVWTALREGSAPEADAYHRRILDLAARAGLGAPTHARVLAALQRAVREGLGPESFAADELLAD